MPPRPAKGKGSRGNLLVFIFLTLLVLALLAAYKAVSGPAGGKNAVHVWSLHLGSGTSSTSSSGQHSQEQPVHHSDKYSSGGESSDAAKSASSTNTEGSNPTGSITGATGKAATPTKTSSSGLSCDIVRMAQVCSHRASTVEYAPDMRLLDRFASLMSKGIYCVDLDVFMAKDGFLLVGYPPAVDRLLEEMGQHNRTAESLTYAELREFNLHHRFPVLSDALKGFGMAVASSPAAPLGQAPKVFLEFKGRAMTQRSLVHAAQQAQLAQVEHLVYIWFTPRPDGSAVMPNLHDLYGLKTAMHSVAAMPRSRLSSDGTSRVDLPERLESNVVAAYDMVGPSLDHSDDFFNKLRGMRRPAAVWTVNTVEQMQRALGVAWAQVLISDYPTSLLEKLAGLRQGCRRRLRGAS